MYSHALQKKYQKVKESVTVDSILISQMWHAAARDVVTKKIVIFDILRERTFVTESPFFPKKKQNLMTHYDSCFESSDSRHANFFLELIKQRNDRMEITSCYLREPAIL